MFRFCTGVVFPDPKLDFRTLFLQGKDNVPGYHLALADGEWVTVR